MKTIKIIIIILSIINLNLSRKISKATHKTKEIKEDKKPASYVISISWPSYILYPLSERFDKFQDDKKYKDIRNIKDKIKKEKKENSFVINNFIPLGEDNKLFTCGNYFEKLQPNVVTDKYYWNTKFTSYWPNFDASWYSDEYSYYNSFFSENGRCYQSSHVGYFNKAVEIFKNSSSSPKFSSLNSLYGYLVNNNYIKDNTISKSLLEKKIKKNYTNGIDSFKIICGQDNHLKNIMFMVNGIDLKPTLFTYSTGGECRENIIIDNIKDYESFNQ